MKTAKNNPRKINVKFIQITWWLFSLHDLKTECLLFVKTTIVAFCNLLIWINNNNKKNMTQLARHVSK